MRGLQVGFGLRQILSDDRGFLAQRELNGGLAGLDTFWRETPATTAASQPDTERTCITGFEEQATIGIGDRDGVIKHHAKDFLERKLGVQEGGGGKQLVEFAEGSACAAGRIRVGDVVDTAEKIGE